MTLEDANKLLAIAKANYSYAFKTMSDQDKKTLVYSWAFVLQDIPADVVVMAFMQLLSTSKWLPTVAEIRERVKRLYYETFERDSFLDRELGEPEESEQKKAARRYIHSATGKFQGDRESMLSTNAMLDGPLGRAIGSGAMIDIEELNDGGRMYLPYAEDVRGDLEGGTA